MTRYRTLKTLFMRYRRPGDIVFACLFLVFSLALLSQIGSQTEWKGGAKLFAEPRFWPAISLSAMTLFAALHFIGSALSERIPGRLAEVSFWVRSIEYTVWFMAYVLAVPRIGYLPASLIFAVLIAIRSGYRSPRMLCGAAAAAVTTVVVFRSFLQVKIPGGAIYDQFPDGLRQIMLTYF